MERSWSTLYGLNANLLFDSRLWEAGTEESGRDGGKIRRNGNNHIMVQQEAADVRVEMYWVPNSRVYGRVCSSEFGTQEGCWLMRDEEWGMAYCPLLF